MWRRMKRWLAKAEIQEIEIVFVAKTDILSLYFANTIFRRLFILN